MACGLQVTLPKGTVPPSDLNDVTPETLPLPGAVPSSITVQTQGFIDPYRFNMFMSDLLAEHASDITRMSGVLNIQVQWQALLHKTF